MSLTQDELVVACGALAWCFNLGPKHDAATGRPLPVPLDKSNSLLIIKPDPFQMAFQPRSDARRREALLLWEEARVRDELERERFLTAARAGRASEKIVREAGLRRPPLKWNMMRNEDVFAIQMSPVSPTSTVSPSSPSSLSNPDSFTSGSSFSD